jgi:hypothetical protein
MNKLSIVVCLILLSAAAAPAAMGQSKSEPRDLYILATTQQSEHSMDSHSETVSVTVSGNKLVYRRVRSGAHGQAPLEKTFTLNGEDQARLAGILNHQHLLITKSFSRQDDLHGRSYYTRLTLSIRSKLQGKQGSITIDGPVNSKAITAEPLYQDSIILLKELCRLVNRTGSLPCFREFNEN